MIDRLLHRLGLPSFTDAAQHERVLLVLIVSVSVLFLMTAGFALVVLGLRASHVRRRRRREARADRWHDAVLDVLGGAAPGTLHARVDAGEEVALLAYLLTFARRVRGDEARALSVVASPYLGAAQRNIAARNAERRANAVQALGAFGSPDHMRAVVDALDDPSPYVAMNAAQALARPDHAAHADQVMERLWRFEQWSPEYLGAMLTRIGPPAADPARRMLADPRQPAHARAVAADVLLGLNDWLGADVAARALDQPDLDPTTAVASLRLLARLGRAEHIDVVRRHTGSASALVRAQAIRTAAALGGGEEVGLITAALHDPSGWVAREAAAGLAQLGQTDVLREFAALDSPVALVARQALAEGPR